MISPYFNNQIGLPISLLGIQSHHEIAVLEMGASQIGEIKDISPIIDSPKISLEDFFINTIDNAEAPLPPSTNQPIPPQSGVTNTTRLAPFLSGNGLKE